jgi:hypothetical protein
MAPLQKHKRCAQCAKMKLPSEILLAGVFLTSCSGIVIPKTDKSEFVDLFENNRFVSYNLNDEGKGNISYLFGDIVLDSGIVNKNQNSKLFFERLTATKVRATIKNLDGDSLTTVLKGKFRQAYYVVNKRFTLGGNPLIWGLKSNSNIIARTKSDALWIYHTHGGLTFLIAVPLMGTSIGQVKIELKQ